MKNRQSIQQSEESSIQTTAIDDVKTKKGLDFLDVATLFHCLLFAYQKALKNILDSGSAIFVHPVLEIVARINERVGINLIEGETIDEVFDNLSRLIQNTEMVKEFRFEKVAPKKFVLHINGCVLAPHVHKELEPKDVTCPYALLAMSIFERVLSGKVKVCDSEYSDNGTKTLIELL